MRLIDADKLRPINAPIAGITRGELTHYEKIVFWETIYNAPTINVPDKVLEIIDKHITSWSGKRYGDPAVMSAFVKLRDDVKALQDGEHT